MSNNTMLPKPQSESKNKPKHQSESKNKPKPEQALTDAPVASSIRISSKAANCTILSANCLCKDLHCTLVFESSCVTVGLLDEAEE